MITDVKIVGASFGNCKNERTFSGGPKYLFSAIEKRANIVAYISTKQLRPWDFLNGAVDFSKTFKYGKPGINVNWLWRKKTLEKLSKRFKTRLIRAEDCNTVIQAGTHVRVELNGVKHYCRTDMTISQSVEARQFGTGLLKGPHIQEAIIAQKSIFESCEGIFTASDWVKESIINDYGIEENKIFVVGAGASVSGDFDINDKKPNFNILFIGRDWERKGGPILIDAFKRVIEHIPESKLKIIGCSPKISHPNVEVLGHLDKTESRQERTITEAFLNATVLCVPSHFEPFGLCFLEAQYYGVVPVTFSGEGRGEAIRNGVTGVLLEERSPEALSEAILMLLNNPDETCKMSIRGYNFCRKNCTWECVAEKTLRVIEKN